MGIIKKECQVILLPTDNASKIVKDKHGNVWFNPEASCKSGLAFPQYQYILSDDEIKEGDWGYNYFKNEIFKALRFTESFVFNEDNFHFYPIQSSKKIIATTNPDLSVRQDTWKDRILTSSPNPTDVFIQQWIANGCPEKIYVDYEEFTTGQCNCICHRDGIVAMHIMACCHTTTQTSVKISDDNTITCSFIESDDVWENIFSKYHQYVESYKQHNGPYLVLEDWLKSIYNPPTKLQGQYEIKEECKHPSDRIRENLSGGRFDECLDCGKTWG